MLSFRFLVSTTIRPTNPFSDLLVETEWSFIRLSRNQTHAGYSLVIAKRHAPELHDLSVEERNGFWSDVATTGRAISDLFQPVKLANLCMGFRIPHFHCHVYPQFQDDDPFRLIDVTEGDVELNENDWNLRVRKMQNVLLEATAFNPGRSGLTRTPTYSVTVPSAGSPYSCAYERERRALLAGAQPCSLQLVCAGALATTADHMPPLSQHDHVPGSGCCALIPACKPCQDHQGGKLVHQRKTQLKKLLPRPSRQW